MCVNTKTVIGYFYYLIFLLFNAKLQLIARINHFTFWKMLKVLPKHELSITCERIIWNAYKMLDKM